MSAQPMNQQEKTRLLFSHRQNKKESNENKINCYLNRSFDKQNSQESFLLESSINYNLLLSNHDQNLFSSKQTQWGGQSKKDFPRVPIKSSKSTLKMIKKFESSENRPKSTNEGFFMKKVSSRDKSRPIPKHIYNITPKPVIQRKSNVIILKSVSPIISKKTRTSRTSVKKLILEPNANEIDQVQIERINLPEEIIATKEKNEFKIRESKQLPVDLYEKILLNAS